MSDENEKSEGPGKRTWIEEIEVAGEELLARVKQLAADNKVKTVRIVEPDGEIALEIPLTYGAIAGVEPWYWPHLSLRSLAHLALLPPGSGSRS